MNENESNAREAEARGGYPPEPPIILDKVLRDMESATPADVPPKASPPEPPSPEADPSPVGLPPRTGIPPNMVPKQAALSPDAPPPPAYHADPIPAAPAQHRRDPLLERSIADPETPRKKSYVSLAVGAMIALNVFLIILIVLMLQDRHLLREEADAPPTPSQIEDIPVIDIDPEPPDRVADQAAVREGARDSIAERDRRDGGTAPRSDGNVLHIPKLELCRSVSGYGDFEPIPEIPLNPHHVPHIQAYVEIAHLKPEPREDGRHIYYMTKAMKLYRTDIGPSEPLMDTTVSLVVSGRSPRSDFYSARPLQASRRIRPGEYTLLVRITDEVSGETASEEARFFVYPEGAPPDGSP